MAREVRGVLRDVGRICDAWLPLRVAYARLPGLSVGIVHKGELVYVRGFGFADVASRTEAGVDTCYRIASISKTFTAVAIMQLVEDGALALDDRITSHLRWFRPSGKTGSPVTIRQALSHTAGVFRDSTTPHWETDEFPDVSGLRRSASARASVIENLTRFKYSNFGFALLGEVIRKVTGSSYRRHMTEAIIEPLGLERTEPDLTAQSKRWLATGYARPIPDVAEREAFTHSAAKAYASATGFLSNVPDLARYLSALALDSDLLLSRESKKELFRPHFETGEPDSAYALGFGVSKVGKRTIVGHGGGYPGFITFVGLDPQDDIGVIVLTNGNDSPAGFIGKGIFQTIDRVMDGERFKGKDNATSLRPYEGTYRSRWVDLCVARVGSTLVAFPPDIDAPLSVASTLRRKGKNTFVIDSPFNFDSVGETVRFTVPANASRATRMVWAANPMQRLD